MMSQVLKGLGALATVLLINYVYRRFSSPLIGRPQPKRGSFWITRLGLVPPPHDGDDMLSEFLIEVGQDQHQSPISVCHSIFGTPLVLVNTLKGIKDVLIDGQAKHKTLGPRVQRGEMIRRIQNLVFGGPSINNAVGDDWRWRRHVLLPPFQPRQLVPNLLPYVAEQALEAMSLFANHDSNGSPIEVDDVFTDLTMNVINYYLYGTKDLNFGLVGGRKNLKLGLGFQSFETWLPFGINETSWAQRGYRPSRERLKDFIRDALAIAEKSHQDRDDKKTYDCVAAAALASGKYDHDREELVNDMLSLTFAGYDTTAHTLSFCFSELARNPDLQDRLFEQIRQVLGPPPVAPDAITPEKLAQLPLVTAVYRETLRKYPAVVFIPVHVNRDTVVDGAVVPGGSEIWCNIRGLQMNPDIFPDPEKFNIDRWIPPATFVPGDENSQDDISWTPENQHRFPDVSFTLGQHSCLGKHLAILELRTVIASAINQYRMTLAPWNKIETKIVLTTKPKNGVWVHFDKRE
ncbi:cytochrome P450 [Hesseltinella vesiculosa]|uniref:Cytochrome P450 n=1 Tax=Hesseltinella vesiculosa TaxID=101127 RepID=A0A1X2GRJ0_9FUNG|nr:cytochrome P450 [Hesseltinella vesiculosa]